MTVYKFSGPSIRAERRGKCPVCGKTTKRSRTFERTVNPFNKDENGVPKTYERVYADTRAEAEAWSPEPRVFEHGKCTIARHESELDGLDFDTIPFDHLYRLNREHMRLCDSYHVGREDCRIKLGDELMDAYARRTAAGERLSGGSVAAQAVSR